MQPHCNTKRIFTPEHRRKISEAMKGKTLSEEHRRKLSEIQKGKPNPRKGLCFTSPETFWDKVYQTEGCWIWTGAKVGGEYGTTTFLGKAYMAHRLAWILSYGPIPKDLHVLHSCDCTPCCNPDHLWLGTLSDNMVDMMAKGRGRNQYATRPGSLASFSRL